MSDKVKPTFRGFSFLGWCPTDLAIRLWEQAGGDLPHGGVGASESQGAWGSAYGLGGLWLRGRRVGVAGRLPAWAAGGLCAGELSVFHADGSEIGFGDSDVGVSEGLFDLVDVVRGLVEPHCESMAQVVC